MGKAVLSGNQETAAGRQHSAGFAHCLRVCVLLAGVTLCVSPRAARAVDSSGSSLPASQENNWVEPDSLMPGENSPNVRVNETTPLAGQAAPEPIAEGPSNGTSGGFLNLGRPDVAPIVEVKTTYDDNIYLDPRDKKSDIYTTVVAGLAVGWGNYRDQLSQLGSFQETYDQLRTPDFDSRQFFYASYTPGYTAFIKYPGEDTLDQNASVGARFLFGGLTCDLRANYQHFSEALVDAGTRVRQGQFDIALNSRYDLNDRTSVEADLNVITHHFDNASLVDSDEFIDQNYFNYQLFPKTNISAGATIGYIAVDSGPNQTYEQALTRVTYDSTHRASAVLFGGVEFRQFSENIASVTNPVFGASMLYSPFDGTNFDLSASRLVTNSAEYVGENIVATTVNLGITQQLFKKIAFNLQASYGDYNYGENGGGEDIHRTDDDLGVQASLLFHVSSLLAVTLTYEYSHNDSTLQRFTFDDNRASIDLYLLF